MKFEKEGLKVEFTKSFSGSCVEITTENDAPYFLDFNDLEWIFQKYLKYKNTREKDEQLEFLYHFADIGVEGASNLNKDKLEKIKKTFW